MANEIEDVGIYTSRINGSSHATGYWMGIVGALGPTSFLNRSHKLDNRIDDPAYRAVKDDLKARLLAHLQATHDREGHRLNEIYWTI